MKSIELTRPPIVEALVDLRVGPRADLRPEELDEAAQALAGAYPTAEAQKGIEFKVEHRVGEAPKQSAKELGVLGLKLTSADGRRIVQIRRDGFTMNWLQPYAGWASLREAALGAWNTYAKCVRPLSVARIATRYINRIEFASDLDSIGGVLRHPSQPFQGEGVVSGPFHHKSTWLEASTGIQANVQLVLELAGIGAMQALVVDIDAFQAEGRTLLAPEELERTLERLRAFKNRLFFGIVSDKCIERYR